MNKYKGYGAVLGDIIGSIYEFKPIYTKSFNFLETKNTSFTDDSILTLATMNKLMHDSNYTLEYKWMGNKYYGDYYGKVFKSWIKQEDYKANFSYGNGTAMRVSPVGYFCKSLDEVYSEAIKSAMVSHTHPEAIKGAICIASCIFKLNNYESKENIQKYVENNFYKLEELKSFEKFKVSCQDTVPVAIKCFLEGKGLEDTIRLAISLGGDCDTIASMAGELCVANSQFVPREFVGFIRHKLDDYQMSILEKFNSKNYGKV